MTLAASVVLTLVVEMPMARLWKIILKALDLGDRGTVKKTIKPETALDTILATPAADTDATELSSNNLENGDHTEIS